MFKKKNYLVIIAILSLFFVSGCSVLQQKREVKLTPEQESNRAYYEAKDVFNQAQKTFTEEIQKYNKYCSNEQYKDACVKVDPYVVKADQALDVWEGIIESKKGDPSGAQSSYVDALKALKTQIILELPNFSW